jgi:glycine/D-amino acid oxidase-like deaminating enzyme
MGPRRARGGVLVVGGGFGGVCVARLLGRRGATIVSAQNSMLPSISATPARPLATPHRFPPRGGQDPAAGTASSS